MGRESNFRIRSRAHFLFGLIAVCRGRNSGMAPECYREIAYAGETDVARDGVYRHAGAGKKPARSGHLFIEDEFMRGFSSSVLENGR